MIPSINLGNDSLGLGAMFSGSFNAFTNAKGTEECGSKPTCIAVTQTCKEKNKIYNDCRIKNLDVKSQDLALRSQNDKTSNNKTLYIVVGSLAALIVIFLIFKR